MPRVARAKVEERDRLHQDLRTAKRLLKVRRARDNLIDFTEITMPHPQDPDDVTRSRYEAKYFHKALAQWVHGA